MQSRVGARPRRLTARVAAMIAAIVVGAGLSTVVFIAPAQAVSCYGDYCSGQDPMQTGCGNDATTVAWKDLTGERLELRWSPTCKTNWARLVVYPTGLGCVGGGDLVARQKDTNYTQHSWLGVYICYISTATTYWTPMIYSPVRLVRAEIAGQVTGWA
jgi:uncharacterized membrane protein